MRGFGGALPRHGYLDCRELCATSGFAREAALHTYRISMVKVWQCPNCGTDVPALRLGSTAQWDRLVELLVGARQGMARREISLMTDASMEDASKWLDHLLRCPKAWPLDPAEEEVARSAEVAFDSVRKPEHFTNYDHCEECAEHDQTLRACDRDTVSRADFGVPGWSPIGFCSAQGLMYYFPALVRYSLMPDIHGYEGLAGLVAIAIGPGGVGNALASVANPAQRSVFVRFARLLSERRIRGADEALELWESPARGGDQRNR